MSFTAFQQQGPTVLVAATSSTGTAATQVCTGNQQGMFLSNPSTVPIYCAVGSSTVAAGQPTTATPCPGLALRAGASFTLTVAGGSSVVGWLSAVTSAGAAAPGVFATPGQWGG